MLASIDIRSGAETGTEFTPIQDRLSSRLKTAIPMEFSTAKSMADGLSSELKWSCHEFRSLVNEFPENDHADYQYRLAECLRLRGVMASSLGEIESAKECCREAIGILEHLRVDHTKESKYFLELGESVIALSSLQVPEQALRALDRTASEALRMAKMFPVVSEYSRLAYSAIAKRAVIEAKTDPISTVESTFRRSIDGLSQLATRYPDQTVIQIPLARTRRKLADLVCAAIKVDESNRSRLEQSRVELELAIRQFDAYLNQVQAETGLQQGDDFNVRTRSELYSSLAETLQMLGRPDEANRARQKSLDRVTPRL
jgi:tetratricopeptide (TPR) repeat protein